MIEAALAVAAVVIEAELQRRIQGADKLLFAVSVCHQYDKKIRLGNAEHVSHIGHVARDYEWKGIVFVRALLAVFTPRPDAGVERPHNPLCPCIARFKHNIFVDYAINRLRDGCNRAKRRYFDFDQTADVVLPGKPINVFKVTHCRIRLRDLVFIDG